ncbi:uncharacterized protein METZ01_LOCUS60994, partial [marine metagenome]
VADVGIEFSNNVNPNFVGSQDGLIASTTDNQFNGFKGNPSDFVEYRQHQGALPKAYFGSA